MQLTVAGVIFWALAWVGIGLLTVSVMAKVLRSSRHQRP